jgi:hypothetical protein
MLRVCLVEKWRRIERLHSSFRDVFGFQQKRSGAAPRVFIWKLGQYPCVATGTYNTMITYIQNVSYIVIRKYFIIHL